MAHEIDYKIHGNDLQMVEVGLDPEEAVQAEVGTMLFMEENIEMQTSTGGGIFSGLKRMVTGDNFFISSFLNKGEKKSNVAFGAPYPGAVIPLDLAQMGPVLCQKDAFLCAAQGIEIDVAFTKKLGAGFFGGEGFILQKLHGEGLAFVHAGGTVIKKDLADGQVLRVDTGTLVAFSQTVDYDIKFMGGFKNVLFGGEGLFLARMKGPGTVYLQSLPFSRLVDRIEAAASLIRVNDEG